MTDNARLIEFARDKDPLAEKFAPEVIWLLLRDLANALEACEKENQQLKAHYQQAIKDLKDYLATEGDKRLIHIHLYRTVHKEVSRAWIERALLCRCGKRKIVQRCLLRRGGSPFSLRFPYWEKTGEWRTEKELWKPPPRGPAPGARL